MKPLLIDTTALVSWLPSTSLRLRALAETRATALPASVKVGVVALVIVTTGAFAVGVIVMSTPAWLLVAWPLTAPLPSRLASLTEMEMRRRSLLAVGSAELLLKVTARRAVW